MGSDPNGQTNALRYQEPAGRAMQSFIVVIGATFGALASACAYLISYHEYRQRMLRLDQNPRRMALGTAIVTFAFFLIASIVLSVVLKPGT